MYEMFLGIPIALASRNIKSPPIETKQKQNGKLAIIIRSYFCTDVLFVLVNSSAIFSRLISNDIFSR